MTKTEIIRELSIKSGIKISDISKVIDGFLEKIKEAVDNNQQVEIRGFGTFSRVKKKERTVNSPIAGKKVRIPEKTVLGFKASKSTQKVSNR